MILIKFKVRKITVTACLLAIVVAVISACGSSDGGSEETAGIGGTGIVVGKLTNFGSVFVNGGRFNTDTSQFIVDGDASAIQSDLAIGMVVRVKVKTQDGNFTGTAIEVAYDDEIQGPVMSISTPGSGDTQRTFDVFRQTITIDEIGTVFEGTTFLGLANNDVVEISGFRTSDNEISATYVEWKEALVIGSEVELRGTVKGYVPPTMQFMLDGILINFDTNTAIDVSNGVLENGQFVEVEGNYRAGPSVDADKIESEEEGFGDDVDDISLQGIISMFNGVADFEIDGQAVDASSAQIKPAGLILVDGLNIEVEGEIVDSKLIADEVELRDGDTKLRAPISSVNTTNNSFRVTYPVATGATTVTVKIDGQTLFEDKTGALPSTPPFSLDDLVATDFVRIEGQELNGEVVASVVKRVDGAGQNLKLEGTVDTFVANSSITILGITYGVDPTPGTGTDFEDFASSAAFFAALNPVGGDFVEIEDDDVADGIADEVELE